MLVGEENVLSSDSFALFDYRNVFFNQQNFSSEGAKNPSTAWLNKSFRNEKQAMRNSFANNDSAPKQPSSDLDLANVVGKKRISNGSLSKGSTINNNNGRPRSQSSLSVTDTNSLLSGNGPLRKSNNQKRVSGSGTTVDGSQLSLKLQTNLIQSVKKSWAKTKRQWDRTGFIHIIYILVLFAYSFVGGAIFMYLDGPHADRVLNAHKNRCIDLRESMWNRLSIDCLNRSFADCENRTLALITQLDLCLRSAPQLAFTYSTSDFWNALIYAITVFTTIGYGNVGVGSMEGRAAMVLYAMVGIPLFFAFLNDMGQWFHFKFLKIYDWIRRKWLASQLYKTILELRRRRISTDAKLGNCNSLGAGAVTTSGGLTLKIDSVQKKKVKSQDDFDKDGHDGLIFTFAVGVLLFYLIVVCGLLMIFVRGQWSFFQAFYFLFQSISLIGFGDEFPDNPNVVLFNITFIIIGIILLSMCFFILQEWIRGKTYRLSTHVRRSMRKWRHQRPLANGGILDRRRLGVGKNVKNTRFSVPMPHLGSGGNDSHWRRRTNRIDENVVAGQRLAVVDDCSPGPGRKALVTVLTYEEEEDQQEQEAPVFRKPSMPRRDGVHSVDESLILGEKWSSKRTPSLAADGPLEAEDAVALRNESSFAGKTRHRDRRHTVMCLDEDFDELKKVPSWLRTNNEAGKKLPKQKRLSYHGRPPARFGKFQWTRQTREEEDDDDDEDQEEREEGALIEGGNANEFNNQTDSLSDSDKDEYL